MKRNLISVIILALCLANLVLTAILIFTVLPETKKANALIDDIATAIKLDLQSGAGNGSTYPIEQQDEYQVNGNEKMTINFKKDQSGQNHYCVVTVNLMVNNQSDQFATMITEGGLAKKESIIKDEINSIIGSKTIDEFNADHAAVKDEILEDLQGYFGADFIVDVKFVDIQTE